MELEYQEFEERLARRHNVADGDRKAFKGRLRVLRDMGVPDKPALGSGKRLKFDQVDLLETHIALTLAAFGLPPLRIALAIKFLRRRLQDGRTSLQGIVDQFGEMTWMMLDVRSNVGKAQDIGEHVEVVIGFHNLEMITQYFVMSSDPEKFWGTASSNGRSSTPTTWHAIINATQLLKDIGD